MNSTFTILWSVIVGDTAWFDMIDKETGDKILCKRIPVTLKLTLPAITNTGHWEVTTWLGSGKYTIKAYTHKPGNIWDVNNPNPGKPWFECTGLKVVDRICFRHLDGTVDKGKGNMAMLQWLKRHMGEEKAMQAYLAMANAQPPSKASSSQSSSSHAAGSHTVKPIRCGWASTNELCRI